MALRVRTLVFDGIMPSVERHPLPKRRHVALEHRRTEASPTMVTIGMDRLGRWIRDARLRASMSQGQLARLAGMHQTTLSRLERGRLEGLQLHRLAALIAVLDAALGDAFDGPIR